MLPFFKKLDIIPFSQADIPLSIFCSDYNTSFSLIVFFFHFPLLYFPDFKLNFIISCKIWVLSHSPFITYLCFTTHYSLTISLILCEMGPKFSLPFLILFSPLQNTILFSITFFNIFPNSVFTFLFCHFLCLFHSITDSSIFLLEIFWPILLEMLICFLLTDQLFNFHFPSFTTLSYVSHSVCFICSCHTAHGSFLEVHPFFICTANGILFTFCHYYTILVSPSTSPHIP